MFYENEILALKNLIWEKNNFRYFWRLNQGLRGLDLNWALRNIRQYYLSHLISYTSTYNLRGIKTFFYFCYLSTYLPTHRHKLPLPIFKTKLLHFQFSAFPKNQHWLKNRWRLWQLRWWNFKFDLSVVDNEHTLSYIPPIFPLVWREVFLSA